ncbi:MAG TPA: hypothetical protein VK081_07075 [Planctomycetota bacterium]|nr:hypothetical protein [Planctomycetota bacterium]
MATHDPHAASQPKETFGSLLAGFFPSQADIGAFVGGMVVGLLILAVLTGLGFLIDGHVGIAPTF